MYCAFEMAHKKLNRDHTHMVCFAKNSQGLKDLWKMSSYANEPDIFHYKARLNLKNYIDLETEKEYFGMEEFFKGGNIQCISGHQGSFLSDNLFANLFEDPEQRKKDIRKAYNQYKGKDRKFYDDLRKPNWFESTCELALDMEKTFGKGNFFIELQNELDINDVLPLWIQPTIVDSLREVAKATGIIAIASSDSHYCKKEEADLQKLMLQINMKETDETVEAKLSDSDNLDIMVFFGSTSFFLHDYEEMSSKFTKEELDNTNKIAEQIEDYDILKKPQVPKYKCPEFDQTSKYLQSCPKESDKFLMQLVIEGAKRLQPWLKNPRNKKEDYWNRLKEETEIIFKYNLSDYLLCVWDFISACNNRPKDHNFNWQENLKNNGPTDPVVIGSGRGSVGGCLTAFFLGVHKADSLKYDLLFSRFFNEARAADLMDIDTDISVFGRDWVLSYMAHKYGERNVGQIITFGRIQGKSSIKDIFRVRGIPNGFEIANKLCAHIPDESKIIDQIQEVRDSGQEFGIIQWALENSEELKIESEKPEYKAIFDQAIRLEGTKRNVSRHASGFIITDGPIDESFPMVLDTKSKKKIIGFDMRDVAKAGGVKLDLLGLLFLDRMKLTQDLVNHV